MRGLSLIFAFMLFSCKGPQRDTLYNYDSLAYRYNCVTCHGKDGLYPTVPGYPKIGGLSEDYLKSQLHEFRAGKRMNSKSKTMHDIARSFTDDVIAELAKEIASYTPEPVKHVPDHPGKKLYAEKGCPACHGENGSDPLMDMYPAIAGQHRDYVYKQSMAIKHGQRTSGNSMVMTGMVAAASDDELMLIAEWLEQVQ